MDKKEVEDLKEIESVFILLEEKGTAFIEEIQTKQMVLNVLKKIFTWIA